MTGDTTVRAALLDDVGTLVDFNLRMAEETEGKLLDIDIVTSGVSAVLEDMIELYRYGAEERDIEMRSDIHRNLSVCVDVNRIRQVLANLLDNAVKYSSEGGHIDVTARRDLADDGSPEMIRIEVRDDGVGIPDDEKDRIWDRLYRSDRSRSEPGLGLGLSLVKAIIESHGGRISVKSEPGQGSLFDVRLPAAT